MPRGWWSPGSRAVGALLLVALALPAPAVPLLGGTPLKDAAEAGGLLVVAGVLLLRPCPSRWLGAAAALAVGGLVLKLAVLLVPAPGFAACYVILAGNSAGGCARSYDEPLQRDGTRRDAVIDFAHRDDHATPPPGLEASNWNLGAVNSLAYNFYKPGEPDRDRLPLRVTWRGAADATTAARFEYVGEGWLEVGGVRVQLPPSYAAIGSVGLPVHAADPVAVELTWDPAAPDGAGPYAVARLLGADGEPLRGPSARGLSSRVAGAAGAVLLLALLCAAAALATALRLHSRVTSLLAVLAVPVATGLAVGIGRDAPPLTADALRAGFLPLIAALCLLRLVASRRHVACAAVLSACVLALELVHVTTGSLDPSAVTPRAGGDDYLTYESHARSVLESGSLRAGEGVFVYSPGFRYTLLAQHLLLGDGDTGIAVLSVVGLLCGLWFAVERLVLGGAGAGGGWTWSRVLGAAPAAAAVAVLTLLVSSPEVVKGGFLLLSEYPTWILMLVGIPVLLTAATPRAASAGVALLAIAFVHRGDQGAGIAAVALLGGLPVVLRVARGRRWRTAALAVLPGLLIALLPALHNAVYGHRLALVAQTPRLPVNFPLPPRALLDLDSAEVRAVLLDQLAGVLATPRAAGDLSGTFRASVLAVQVGLVVLLVAALARRFRGRWRGGVYVLVPVAYLLPHLFIQVYVYYPRHVVAGYLAGALVLLAVAGGRVPPRGRDERGEGAPLERPAAAQAAATAGFPPFSTSQPTR